VLQTGKAVMTVNLGFRPKDNTVFTYTQEKIGWNYFYVKRKVLANEIHTVPLDITLSFIHSLGTKLVVDLMFIYFR
jgi:hypothetical protein